VLFCLVDDSFSHAGESVKLKVKLVLGSIQPGPATLRHRLVEPLPMLAPVRITLALPVLLDVDQAAEAVHGRATAADAAQSCKAFLFLPPELFGDGFHASSSGELFIASMHL